MPRPDAQSLLPLGCEVVALVHCSHALDCALHVVQQPVGDVRRDAELGQARDAGAAEIVQPPVRQRRGIAFVWAYVDVPGRPAE